MTEKEIRAVVLARTLLFNYGQGIWSPISVYMDLCKLTGIKTRMSALPAMKPLPIRLSFFSKMKWEKVEFCCYWDCPCADFVLYHGGEEERQFMSQSRPAKLCWLNNFNSMQHLLFMFEQDDYMLIQSCLNYLQRPTYDPLRLPFQVA